MSIDEILSEHLQLCEETYQTLSEENNLLKEEGRLDDAFIERKQELLRKLDISLASLKNLNTNPQVKTQQTDQLIDKAQKRLMQIFLLDRQNERLLKASANTSGKTSAHSRKANPAIYTEQNVQAETYEDEGNYAEDGYEEEYPEDDEDAYYEANAEYAEDDDAENYEYSEEETPAPQEQPPPRKLHRAYRQHLELNEDIAAELPEDDKL